MMMGNPKPFATLAAIVIGAFLAASVVLHPNRWSGIFGTDVDKGTDAEKTVARAKQVTRAKKIEEGIQRAAKELGSLAEEQRRLGQHVRWLRSQPDVDRRKLEESGIPQLLARVAEGPDDETLAGFEAEAQEIRRVRQGLSRGDPLNMHMPFLDAAAASLETIRESNKERRNAVNELLKMFPGTDTSP